MNQNENKYDQAINELVQEMKRLSESLQNIQHLLGLNLVNNFYHKAKDAGTESIIKNHRLNVIKNKENGHEL